MKKIQWQATDKGGYLGFVENSSVVIVATFVTKPDVYDIFCRGKRKLRSFGLPLIYNF